MKLSLLELKNVSAGATGIPYDDIRLLVDYKNEFGISGREFAEVIKSLVNP
jgi:hypothetical protein